MTSAVAVFPQIEAKCGGKPVFVAFATEHDR